MAPRKESPQRVLDRLRRLCLALPGTCETPTWGHPNFRAGKKIFAAFHADSAGSPCIWLKLGPLASDVTRGDPRFSPSRHGAHRWGGLRADLPLDWSRVRELVLGSYRLTAARALVRELDGIDAKPRSRRAQGTGAERKPATRPGRRASPTRSDARSRRRSGSAPQR
jgi:predicted DNA-binding protein (MmcQ/YjbR family)